MTERNDFVSSVVEDVLEKIRIHVKLRELEQSARDTESVREQLGREAMDKLSDIENYLYYALDTAYDDGRNDGSM
tara:strand:+ start:207 stop:431 length:225 start_codon:yes stop_codon:yes gene_type:complete